MSKVFPRCQLFFVFCIIFSSLFLAKLPFVFADTIVPGGNITSNTTWTLAGSPYVIQGTIQVNPGVMLTIEPGVAVKFDGLYSINVQGILYAVGTPSSFITVSSNKPNPTPLDWQSINLNGAGASVSQLSYIDIRHGTNAIAFSNSSPTVSQIIATNNNTAFNINNSFAVISDVITSNNGTAFLIFNGSAPIISNSLIFNNFYGFLLEHMSSVASPIVNNCSIYGNSARNVNNIGSFSSNGSINFENNWWGTTDPLPIGQGIWDHYDQEVRPFIDFTPFLDGEGGNPIGTSVTGAIAQNTVWTTSGSPYYIGSNNVTVNSGVALTIQEGVAVRVEANYALRINGVLNAQGTPSNLITFSPVIPNPNPVLLYWLGLQLNNSESSASQISYIRISFAYTGLVIKNGSSPAMDHIKVDQNRTGIEIDRAGGADPDPSIQQSSIYGNFDKNVRIIGNYLDPSRVLNFEMNWWGTVNESTIDSSIVDHVDNVNLPTVDYIPYLTSESGTILVAIDDVSRSPTMIDPQVGETTTIFYTLILDPSIPDANVTIEIYDELTNNLKRTLISGVPKTAGLHSEIWDGRNDSGNFLPYEAYYIKIRAQIPGETYSYIDPFGGSPGPNVDDVVVQNGSFNPYQNEKLSIQYTVPEPGRQLIEIRQGNTANAIRTLAQSELKIAGPRVDLWDGRTDSGGIYTGSYHIFFGSAVRLRKNTVILRNPSVSASDILSQPYLLMPVQSEIATLSYDLVEASIVTALIALPNGGHFRTLLNEALQPSGSHSLVWDGKNDLGEYASLGGDYYFVLQTHNPTSGAPVETTGNIRIQE